MHPCVLLAALVLGQGADPGRWVEVLARPADAAAAARIEALGFEVKPAEEGLRVFLPARRIEALAATGVPWTLAQADVEGSYAARLAAAGGTALLAPGSMGGYFTFAEAVAEMDALAAAYPALVAPKLALGTTHQGREIWAWKLSRNPALSEPEPAAVVMSLMHAREPAGMMSVLHLAERLLAGYGSDPEATWLLDHRAIWLVPVLNPDGYVYNETQRPGGGGMWRKNRRDNGDGSFGVDPNRNFSFEWARDDAGSSPATGSDVYRGPAPLSEPETQALRDLILAQAPAVSVNVHTFSDVVIRPYGYADRYSTEDAIFDELSDLATRGNAYRPGNCQQTLGYLANGSHDDYMWGEVAAKPRVYGVTPELGNGNDGFWPAPERIDPIRREALPMLRELLWVAGAAPRLFGQAIDDAAPAGDADGYPEPGESVTLSLVLRNHGLEATSGALLAALEGEGCEALVLDAPRDLGQLDARSDAAVSFQVRLAGDAAPGSLARLRLRLRDAGGEYPPLPLAFLIGEPVVLFAEDFEAGLGRWGGAGFSLEAAGAGRPGQALSDSAGANYANGRDDAASPLASFDLAAWGRVWLEFAQRRWIDNDFDAASIEVSSPASAGWVALPGGSSDAGSGVGAQAAGAPVWDGHRRDWAAERVDLSAHAGAGMDRVSFRLRFRSDGSIGYDGWHVDDLRLLAFPAAAPPLLPNAVHPLLAVRQGDDVLLSWPAPAVDAGHGAAQTYALFRSPVPRADRGFLWLGQSAATSARDAAAPPGASFAYAVAAENCAGRTTEPPP